METVNTKKTFWSDAARYGGILGLVVAAAALISAYTTPGKFIIPVVELAAFAWLMYRFLRARGAKFGTAGFSYGQCISFVLAMMLFTGIISGATNFIINTYLRPDLMEEALELAMQMNPQLYNVPGMEDSMALMGTLMKNPLFQLFGGIFGMIFYGGIIGLIVSAFAKRERGIFADTNSDVSDGNAQA